MLSNPVLEMYVHLPLIHITSSFCILKIGLSNIMKDNRCSKKVSGYTAKTFNSKDKEICLKNSTDKDYNTQIKFKQERNCNFKYILTES